ncbi:glycosyl hydrolase family 18 protein [Tepidibacter sp. Z1-5]|uniref:glycosyl hydrolase family 18 protein n=1 Tax=Tepidibacter sp. Z1-5 TaxID=3134138 RepID=UPI0030BA73A9
MKYSKNILALFLILFVFILNTNEGMARPRKNKIPPNAPTQLSATSINSTNVTLNWSYVSKASGYKVYRSNLNDSNYTLVSTASSTTYKDSNLDPSTDYWYFIKAYNQYGLSQDSIHIKITTQNEEPTPIAPIPVDPINPTKTVLGFTTYYYEGDSSSYNSMVSNSSMIDTIATHNYTTDGNGNIIGLIPNNQITYANDNGISALAMVANNFDGNIAKTLLENPTNRQNLINNILSQLNANNYKGVNIDLEGVFYYDRSYYTTFIKELYNTLNSQGFTITVSVPAKTSDSPTSPWSGAYDYAELGKYADKVVLMTYDEHYPGGSPGPIASINWVENVINYATSVIPKEKILLGTAAYGYDWSSNGTKAYSISGIYNLASTCGSSILWDSTSQCPYFTYTDSNGISHTVWFENDKSISYKLDLVNNYDLSGIAIWRLGLENSDYWTTIKNKLNK